MRSRVVAFAAVVAVSVSLFASSGAAEGSCATGEIAFRDPIRLGVGRGYEPGIDIDSTGTIYVTAHKLSLAAEELRTPGGEPRTASFLWRSTDDGTSFHNLQGLMGVTRFNYALEGDIAIDAKDRMYFSDTYGADQHFYRWSDNGDTLDFFRAGVFTNEVDDRPWLTAHHDGLVYYMSNSVNAVTGRMVVHRSTDGGATFDPIGRSFPDSFWGFLDADPNSDYVYVFVNELSGNNLVAYVSPDRGETWSKRIVGQYQFGYNVTNDHDDAYPTVAVSPKDGSVVTLWTDNGRKLMLGRSTDRGQTWDVHDITPFEGRYGYPWVTVGPTGDVGITWLGNAVGKGSFVYGMIWRPDSSCELDGGGSCTGPAASYARLQTKFVGDQADFFQGKFSPDGALNATYKGIGDEILYTKQTAGPNLSGTSFCGLVGTP